MTKNWISIFDNTAESRILYASESVTQITGWAPEELYGKSGYELIHPGDLNNARKIHISNVLNEKMSHMTSYRFNRKNGGHVEVESIIHYSFDAIATCTYIYDENSFDHKSRVNNVDEVYHCLPDGSLICDVAKDERIKYNILKEELWKENHQVDVEQEPRFCLILSRTTDELNIVYISKAAKDIVSMDGKYMGKSLYNFVLESDIPSVRSQIDLTKKHNTASKLRFDWITSKESNESAKAVEAVISSADDGVVMVIRLAPVSISK